MASGSFPPEMVIRVRPIAEISGNSNLGPVVNTPIRVTLAFVGAALGLSACHEAGRTALTQAVILDAEARSEAGANPAWLKLTNQPALFKGVRERAYRYCLAGKSVDPRCASEQDRAVDGSIAALSVVTEQAQMRDKDRLGLKEKYVAENPEIAPQVEKACWALYKEHGAADARILSVCLGNLTDYSPLIPLPVP